MMKKVLFGVAMALLACGSVGTLQSCKDDVSDLRTQTAFDLGKLQQDLISQNVELLRLINKNKDDIAANLTAIQTNAANIATNKADILTNKNNIAKNRQDIDKLIQDLQLYANKQYVIDEIDKLKKELNGDLVIERGRIDALVTENQNRISDIASAVNRIIALEEALNGVNGAGGLKDQVGNLTTDVATLKTDYQTLSGLVAGHATDIANLQSGMSTANAEISTIKTTLTDLQTQIDGALSKINTLSGDIDDLKTELQDLKNQVVTISTKVGRLEQELIQLEEAFEDFKDEFADYKEEVNDKFETVNSTIAALTTRVDQIRKELDQLASKFDNLVTAVLIQSVNSPVFGDFSLPIGVKSNLVFNWYGYRAGEDMTFPSSEWKAYSATGDAGVSFQGANTETIPDGVYPSTVKLGTVYVSLNPQGNNFDGDSVRIVNSRGEVLPVKVKALRPSNKLLTHGYSRATEQIGSALYEADIELDATDSKKLEQVRISLDDKLESAMKDAVKDIKNRELSKSNAAALLKGLYDQMSGMLPAYALEYGWTLNPDPETSAKSYKVLSQYDLAVATARPLGYNFLEGKGIDRGLPILDDIDNLILKLVDDSTFNLKIKEIKIDSAKIQIPDIKIKVKGDNESYISDKGGFIIHLPKIDVTVGNSTGHTVPKDITVEGKDLNAVYDAIDNGIKTALNGVVADIKEWTGDMQIQMNKQIDNIIGNIQSQINDMLKDVNGQIDSMIKDVAHKFDPFFDRANQAFHIYNRIANKINRIIKNPNAYLQVTALYNMSNGDYGFVSGSATRPTTFSAAGGDSFTLYLTSYTGELIVPAYKKYVAITGKVVNGSVQKVDWSINSGDDLNKVLEGNQIRVNVPVANLDNGVYEFTYQALDYRGYTSTRKFYVQIVK